MTAKSKRPFYVFAAVALLCSMVMISGVMEGRADDARRPVQAAPQGLDDAVTLSPSPHTATVARTPGSTGEPGPGLAGDVSPDPALVDPRLKALEQALADQRMVTRAGTGRLTGPDGSLEDEDAGGTPPEVDDPTGPTAPTVRARNQGKGKGKPGNNGNNGNGPGSGNGNGNNGTGNGNSNGSGPVGPIGPETPTAPETPAAPATPSVPDSEPTGAASAD